MDEVNCGDMCMASDDGKHWEIVKYLFFDEHNDEYVCLVDQTYCQSFQQIKVLTQEL